MLDTTAADYWRALYLATLALLLGFRVVAPLVNALRYRMRVAEVVSEAPGVVSLRIAGRGLHRLDAQAGQFFLWRFLTRGRWWALLIAGGIGITPVRALLEEAGGDVTVVYRTVTEADVIFRDELGALARERGARPHIVVGDHATEEGGRLLSPDHLRSLVPDLAERDVYVCGPPAMAAALVRNVRRAGVPRGHIQSERFAL